MRGESSPNYTAYPQHVGVPERMHSLIPDAKLIYVVRDPLERIAAHWVHNYAKRREKGDLRATLTHPQHLLHRSAASYHMQLQQFLRYYPREQVLVLEQEELRRDRAATLRPVFEFVGVDPDFTPSAASPSERHQTSRKTRADAPRRCASSGSAGRRGGRVLPTNVWLAVDKLLPLRRPIERPDVRAALGPEALAVLREDAERLRELTGRDFEHWSIWR